MSPESGAGELNLSETELTLGLPGDSRAAAESIESKSGAKRVFSDDPPVEDDGSSTTAEAKSPAPKAQVVGWPPVRSFRRNTTLKRGKFVKVAADGAPYLRKVDLELYRNYQHLLNALEDMFSGLTIRNYLNERKAMDPATANGVEYVPTYEDRDGDWMLVGDVPWKMFVDSCKRLRLMKSSEAIGLERTPLQCISSS